MKFPSQITQNCFLKNSFQTLVKLLWASFAICAAFILNACSQESDAFINVQWHNLNARYNAYHLGKEKIKEVDRQVVLAHKDNFNRVLEIYPKVDKAGEQALNAGLTETVKKASIVIQRHKNSAWVDDAYILIGRARMYRSDEQDLAVNTFKYINSKSKDKDSRHTALIYLLRIYIHNNEMNNARLVMDYLRKQSLTKKNMYEYLSAKAWYYAKEKEPEKVEENLRKALSYMPKLGDRKARYHFIVGQLNQQMNRDSLAYHHYKKCVRLVPAYEMNFNAKLAMASTSPLTDPKEVKRIQGIFKKMLKDPKNEEFKDKIYYEMARFEHKRKLIDDAIVLYNKSLRAEAKSKNLKGYSYLKLAEINYYLKKDFIQAKYYYDSTVANLDTLEENYKQIVKRQKSLAEFLVQYQTIAKEDTAQLYASLDSTKLLAKIDDRIAKDIEKEKKQEAAKKAAEKAAKKLKAAQEANEGVSTGNFDGRSGLGFDASKNGADGQWYFSNPATVGQGKNDFIKKWGNRKLGDNWRRSQKETNFDEQDPTADSTAKNKDAASANKNQTGKDGENKDGTQKGDDKEGLTEGKETKSAEDDLASRRKRYLNQIPKTPEDMDSSQTRLRRALFAIGKIYDQQLEEFPNAIHSFDRVINDHPNFEKIPEALYFEYLIFSTKARDDKRKDEVKQKLISEYPQSLYTKLILDPDYLSKYQAANDAVRAYYQQAYEYYEADQYIESQRTLKELNNRFPFHAYQDKVALLNALIVGRTMDFNSYKDSLLAFKSKFPKSPLNKFASELLSLGDKFMAKISAAKIDSAAKNGAVSSINTNQNGKPATPYGINTQGDNIYVVVLPLNSIEEVELQERFSRYNQVFYTEKTFDIRTRLLDEKTIMLTVSGFRSSVQALNYLKKQDEDKAALQSFKKTIKMQHFVITPDNLKLFFRSKDVKEYLDFFKANYDMSEL